MTIAMSEQVDAEPCDVLRGGDGPVYFLLSGRLYVVHEILGRWIEPDAEPQRRVPRPTASQDEPDARGQASRGETRERAQASRGETRERAEASRGETRERAQVEHWLVVASVGRFGTPGVFRLQRRPAPPSNGPDTWTARAEKR